MIPKGIEVKEKKIKVTRDISKEASIIMELERAFIKMSDWEVRENANVSRSYGSFIGFIVDKLLKRPDILSAYLPQDAVKMHFDGDIHIHKLPHSLFIPYCAGWSFSKILRIGLKTPTVQSRPAKHMDTAISHLVNFFYLAAQEWTGAQAITAFDLYLAPFVRADGLNERAVKQNLQKMVFELNYPTRIGYQSPYTNITLILDTVKEFLEGEAIVGGKKIGYLGDYLNEAILISKKLSELYLEGDAVGQPFTFPILTLMVTKNFDWNNNKWDGLTDLIFEVLSRRGSFYLLNGYATDVSALYAMCCRLTIDTSKLRKNGLFSVKSSLATEDVDDVYSYLKKSGRIRGMWAMPDATGSIGVVTINLPRIAIESDGDLNLFYDMLDEKLEIARKVLLTWRRRYEKTLEAGFMPLTKIYLGHLNAHFNTFGLVGLPEAVMNLMKDPHVFEDLKKGKEAVKLMKEIVSFVRKRAEEWENVDGYLYNVEEVPAESTSYRLAKIDYEKFHDLIKKGKVFIPIWDGKPFYSNSIVPYYIDIPLSRRVMWEADVQQEFTGGVMLHIFFHEAIDPKALKKLVYNIVTKTKSVYFSITPSITVCPKCGWHGVGIYDQCPKCGNRNVDIWSRIVGYYRPIRSWNEGKQAEFISRIHYGKFRVRPSKVLRK